MAMDLYEVSNSIGLANPHGVHQSTPAPDEDGGTPHRSLPNSIETEQALLGAVLVNNEVYHVASEMIDPSHFYEPFHGRVFETIGRLIEKGRVASPLTVAGYLETDPVLREVGGPGYLGRMAAAATSPINVRDFARSIFDLSVRRGLIDIGEDMINRAFDIDIDDEPTQQIVDVEQSLYEISEKGKFGKGFVDFAEAAAQALNRANEAFQREGKISGIPSGFTDLDKRLGGLNRSDLLILAGRPGMGKTSLATNIAFNVARSFRTRTDEFGRDKLLDGGRVAFFSLEMANDQLATRILSEQASVPAYKIRDGSVTQADFERLAEAVTEIQHMPLYIDDTGGLSISAVASRARRMARKTGLDVIVIDYVQLMTGSGKKRTDNRVQELTEITTGLKALAKELNVPIIALSQLSRAVESRDDKRPQLSDLRESGSIEQDADIVLFIFREEYYHDQKRPPDPDDYDPTMSGDRASWMSERQAELEKWTEKKEMIKNKAEVIIAKNRHGSTGPITMHFDPEITRFHDYAPTDRYGE